MSTPPAPARLAVIVASKAPVAAVIRRGPTQWSQLVKWNLKTDEFEPGQWLRGVVQYASLSPNGKHIGLCISVRRSRTPFEESQYSVVSRLPYFTALAIRIRHLSENCASFTSGGDLAWGPESDIEFRAKNPCPYRIGGGSPSLIRDRLGHEFNTYNDEEKWRESLGRTVTLRDGQVWENKEDGDRLLFDANLYQPQEVETPDWALRW